MKKLSSFNDKQTLNLMRNELNEALNKIVAKYGLSPSEIGNVRYDNATFKTSIELKIEGAAGVEERNAEMMLRLDGLKVGDRIKTPNGLVLVISGYNHRARKSPVNLVGEQDRKTYKAPVDFCKRNLIKSDVKQTDAKLFISK